MKKLNDFTVTDLHALAAFNPKMVKMIPNYGAIRSALRLGFELPGVEQSGKGQTLPKPELEE